MPYSTVSEVPEAVPQAKKKQWMEVWNSAYKKAKADGKSDAAAEETAFAQAWGVIKKESKSFRERGFANDVELRVKADGKPGIEGYAAVFNSLSEKLGYFRERIKPGAFSRALREKQDVRALINHDASQIIGRTKNGTLTLREDKHGLAFSVDLPDTQAARDLMELVRRGDIDSCSFGFMAVRENWTDQPSPEDPKRTINIRELEDVDLFDVSAVTFPAYPAASLSARELWPDGVPDEVRQHVPELRETKTKRVADADLTADCFAYVGDPQDTSTWKLPIKFPGDAEKTKSHIRNALARFNQTQGIPADEKDKVWRKLVAAAKAHDIDVTEEKSRRQMESEETNENGCECDCAACEDDNDAGCTNSACDDADCASNGCPHQKRSRVIDADTRRWMEARAREAAS